MALQRCQLKEKTNLVSYIDPLCGKSLHTQKTRTFFSNIDYEKVQKPSQEPGSTDREIDAQSQQLSTMFEMLKIGNNEHMDTGNIAHEECKNSSVKQDDENQSAEENTAHKAWPCVMI